MYGNFRRLPAVLVLCLTASAVVGADDETISAELVTLSLDGGVPAYFIRTGGETTEIQATPKGIGAPVSYRGPRTLWFYANRADATPRKKGEAAAKPTLAVQLPSGHNRILLVFSSAGTKEKKVPGVHALGISTGNLKEGDYRIFNLSHQTVYAVLAGKKATVPPGKPVDLSSASWRTDTMDMEVKLGLRDQGELRAVYSSVWGHRPGRRMFLFILDRSDKFRPLDIRRFFDTPKRGNNR